MAVEMNTEGQREKQGDAVLRRKALLVTHVSGFVPQFEMNNVRILQRLGYEVHYASNFHTPSYGTDNHRLDGTGSSAIRLILCGVRLMRRTGWCTGR